MDYYSEYILSNLFRLKKGPPSNNEIDAKFVSQGCVFLDKLIYPISTQINNEPNYQLYYSIVQQELNNNKNSPLLSNGIYSHMGLYIKNIDINFFTKNSWYILINKFAKTLFELFSLFK